MYDLLFKFIVVGDTGIGKSCLVLRFTNNKFNSAHDMTIGVEFGSRMIEVDGKHIKAQIWDTAGQESFKSITRSYYRNATGVLLCYDVTNKTTFKNVSTWLTEIEKECRQMPVIILVGNKTDIPRREVTTKEGQDFADEHGMLFIETSAKNAQEVDNCFIKLSRAVSEKVKQMIENRETNFEERGIKFGMGIAKSTIDIDVDDTNKRWCCYR